MNTILDAWQDTKIPENYIRQFHRDLLTYSHKNEWHRGNYKAASNSVADFDENGRQIGIVFETARPFDTRLQDFFGSDQLKIDIRIVAFEIADDREYKFAKALC